MAGGREQRLRVLLLLELVFLTALASTVFLDASLDGAIETSAPVAALGPVGIWLVFAVLIRFNQNWEWITTGLLWIVYGTYFGLVAHMVAHAMFGPAHGFPCVAIASIVAALVIGARHTLRRMIAGGIESGPAWLTRMTRFL